MDDNKSGNKDNEVIDLRIILRKVNQKKKLFYKTLPIVFVLSCAYILCIPRYYASSLSLAPELSNGPSMSGTLGSIASSFGFDLGGMQTTDAISPLLYPDLMEDNAFVVDLFSIMVESEDGEIKCNYYDYLDKYQKSPWWSAPIKFIKSLLPEDEESSGAKGKNDPYILSKAQDDIAKSARSNIDIRIDKKTNVISISVQAQDPLICKTLADSVKARLQLYITKYRTNKARIDEEYYKELAENAKKDYEKARQLYGAFADANTNIALQSVRSKQTDLENDMQLKYNTYSAMMTQYQAARAKVQERTPAFTTIKGASVPIKPTGPKRMLFVFSMIFLAIVFTTLYAIKEDIQNLFKI